MTVTYLEGILSEQIRAALGVFAEASAARQCLVRKSIIFEKQLHNAEENLEGEVDTNLNVH